MKIKDIKVGNWAYNKKLSKHISSWEITPSDIEIMLENPHDYVLAEENEHSLRVKGRARLKNN